MRTWSVLLGMAVAATLAGCGGGESKPGGEPPKPAPAAPAPQAATRHDRRTDRRSPPRGRTTSPHRCSRGRTRTPTRARRR